MDKILKRYLLGPTSPVPNNSDLCMFFDHFCQCGTGKDDVLRLIDSYYEEESDKTIFIETTPNTHSESMINSLTKMGLRIFWMRNDGDCQEDFIDKEVFIEDCEVCCNPIEASVVLNQGALESFNLKSIEQ